MNEYGNIELFNGDLPSSTCWVNLPKVMSICKKLEIEAVPALIGFDKLSDGRSVPVISGAVCFEKDRKMIIEQFMTNLKK